MVKHQVSWSFATAQGETNRIRDEKSCKGLGVKAKIPHLRIFSFIGTFVTASKVKTVEGR